MTLRPIRRSNDPVPVSIDPQKFYSLTKLIADIKEEQLEALRIFEQSLVPVLEGLDNNAEVVAKAVNSVIAEEQRFMRRKQTLAEDDLQQDPEDIFANVRSNVSFLQMVFSIVEGIRQAYSSLYSVTESLRPGTLVMLSPNDAAPNLRISSFEQLQHMKLEFEVNEPTINRFIASIATVEVLPRSVVNLANNIHRVLENYYKMLLHRHSVEGIEVHGKSPIATDLAITIYDNVDANGEIQDGKDPNEVSAYTIRKAEILAKTLKNGLVGEFIRTPKSLNSFIASNLKSLFDVSSELEKMFEKHIKGVKAIMRPFERPSTKNLRAEFATALLNIDAVDPQNISFREKTTLLSAEERYNLRFRNDTLAQVAKMLSDDGTADASVIEYILNRKAELRRYFQDENSFYVCRIGQGNPFTGEAPGGLTVVPGTRPRASLDEILGSGFDEVKRFFGSIESASRFNDLFIATSPSRSADKSNVLLVGPQGCGKTEILRAVASDKNSIGIFAQGSDFNTCWKGEAEKNPKRMFEAGVKLQRESKRHVHFLIDEIDAVLNNDKEYGSFNLTLEFQIIMDGVVEYPHLSVWGATNNPERIPMPMIRRFAKVLIVGELDKQQRMQLLKHFVSFLPLNGMTDEAWEDAAERLDGATGDVIRKIADAMWRDKMAVFTYNNPIEAERLVKFLNDNGEKFDVRSFSTDRRQQFHDHLKPFVSVTPEDLHETISTALDNIAIHNEIETAKLTYNRARAFLSNLNKTRSQKANGKKVVEAEPVQQPAE